MSRPLFSHVEIILGKAGDDPNLVRARYNELMPECLKTLRECSTEELIQELRQPSTVLTQLYEATEREALARCLKACAL